MSSSPPPPRPGQSPTGRRAQERQGRSTPAPPPPSFGGRPAPGSSQQSRPSQPSFTPAPAPRGVTSTPFSSGSSRARGAMSPTPTTITQRADFGRGGTTPSNQVMSPVLGRQQVPTIQQVSDRIQRERASAPRSTPVPFDILTTQQQQQQLSAREDVLGARSSDIERRIRDREELVDGSERVPLSEDLLASFTQKDDKLKQDIDIFNIDIQAFNKDLGITSKRQQRESTQIIEEPGKLSLRSQILEKGFFAGTSARLRDFTSSARKTTEGESFKAFGESALRVSASAAAVVTDIVALVEKPVIFVRDADLNKITGAVSESAQARAIIQETKEPVSQRIDRFGSNLNKVINKTPATITQIGDVVSESAQARAIIQETKEPVSQRIDSGLRSGQEFIFKAGDKVNVAIRETPETVIGTTIGLVGTAIVGGSISRAATAPKIVGKVRIGQVAPPIKTTGKGVRQISVLDPNRKSTFTSFKIQQGSRTSDVLVKLKPDGTITQTIAGKGTTIRTVQKPGDKFATQTMIKGGKITTKKVDATLGEPLKLDKFGKAFKDNLGETQIISKDLSVTKLRGEASAQLFSAQQATGKGFTLKGLVVEKRSALQVVKAAPQKARTEVINIIQPESKAGSVQKIKAGVAKQSQKIEFAEAGKEVPRFQIITDPKVVGKIKQEEIGRLLVTQRKQLILDTPLPKQTVVSFRKVGGELEVVKSPGVISKFIDRFKVARISKQLGTKKPVTSSFKDLDKSLSASERQRLFAEISIKPKSKVASVKASSIEEFKVDPKKFGDFVSDFEAVKAGSTAKLVQPPKTISGNLPGQSTVFVETAKLPASESVRISLGDITIGATRGAFAKGVAASSLLGTGGLLGKVPRVSPSSIVSIEPTTRLGSDINITSDASFKSSTTTQTDTFNLTAPTTITSQQSVQKQQQIIQNDLGQVQSPVSQPQLRPIGTRFPPVKEKLITTPPFDLDLPKKAKKKEQEQKGYDVYVREAGRFVKVNEKPKPFNRAWNYGASVTDNTVAATFKLKESGITNLPEQTKNEFLRSKFDKRKNNKYVEKNKHRIDTPGELQGITVKGWLARRASVLKLESTKRKKKGSKDMLSGFLER